jgi:hypothetical protein
MRQKLKIEAEGDDRCPTISIATEPQKKTTVG